MAFLFTGFLLKREAQPGEFHSCDSVERVIRFHQPFDGAAIRIGSRPNRLADVKSLARELGLHAEDWLFPDYDTWAGKIDHTHGVSQINGTMVELGEGEPSNPEDHFIALMDAFGIPPSIALDFPPFYRDA